MRQGELSGQPISIPALSFPTRGITIRGVSVGRWVGLPEPVRTADIDAAISLARTRTLLTAGIGVTLSNSRGPASLEAVVAELGAGARAGTVVEAASADIVMLALPWKRLEAALAGLSHPDYDPIHITSFLQPGCAGP